MLFVVYPRIVLLPLITARRQDVNTFTWCGGRGGAGLPGMTRGGLKREYFSSYTTPTLAHGIREGARGLISTPAVQKKQVHKSELNIISGQLIKV